MIHLTRDSQFYCFGFWICSQGDFVPLCILRHWWFVIYHFFHWNFVESLMIASHLTYFDQLTGASHAVCWYVLQINLIKVFAVYRLHIQVETLRMCMFHQLRINAPEYISKCSNVQIDRTPRSTICEWDVDNFTTIKNLVIW